MHPAQAASVRRDKSQPASPGIVDMIQLTTCRDNLEYSSRIGLLHLFVRLRLLQ
jgi:hypothetical protein